MGSVKFKSVTIGSRVPTIRIDGAHYVPLLRTPRPTVINHLIYSASGHDVSDVFVDGQHLIASGGLRNLNERSVISDAQEAIQDFVQVSGIASEITKLKWGTNRHTSA